MAATLKVWRRIRNTTQPIDAHIFLRNNLAKWQIPSRSYLRRRSLTRFYRSMLRRMPQYVVCPSVRLLETSWCLFDTRRLREVLR